MGREREKCIRILILYVLTTPFHYFIFYELSFLKPKETILLIFNNSPVTCDINSCCSNYNMMIKSLVSGVRIPAFKS